jgi:hypothetical protein
MFVENCFSSQTNVEFDCVRVKQVRKIPITDKNIVKSIENWGKLVMLIDTIMTNEPIRARVAYRDR